MGAETPPSPQNLLESKTLCGFWEKIRIDPKDSTRVPWGTGDYKLIDSNGAYFVFNARPVPVEADGSRSSFVTTVIHYGNYEVVSDSAYVEYKAGSHRGIMKETSVIDLHYKRIDPDCLEIECGARGYKKRLRELWRRIKPFDPGMQEGRSLPRSPEPPNSR